MGLKCINCVKLLLRFLKHMLSKAVKVPQKWYQYFLLPHIKNLQENSKAVFCLNCTLQFTQFDKKRSNITIGSNFEKYKLYRNDCILTKEIAYSSICSKCQYLICSIRSSPLPLTTFKLIYFQSF